MNAISRLIRKIVVNHRQPSQPIKNARNSVPGQQLGLYSDNKDKDVRQMTRTLNNPSETEQENRG